MNTSEQHKATQSSCKLVLFLCPILTDHTGFVGTNLYLLNLPINMYYRDELNIDGGKHVFACLNKLRIILNE